MSFKGIRPGDRVTALRHDGLMLVNGKAITQYKRVTATVNRLLIFDDHVVIYHGPFGLVVDKENYVKHTSPKKSASSP